MSLRSNIWLALLASISTLNCASATEHASESAPNIVFILADDLGWSDLGCYGNDYIETPVLDALAAQGVRLTAAYTAPVCTPSRGMILSGQSSARTGLYKVPFKGNERPWASVIPPVPWGDQPVDSQPIGALLAKGGYRCSLVGKVHVPPAFVAGMDSPSNPEAARAALGEQFYAKLLAFTRDNPEKQIGPICRQAIDFIASQSEGPFFCYVGHHAPHIPLEPRADLKAKYEARWQQRPAAIHPHYAAMCEALDESVGLVLEALDILGLREHTLVVFTSDNGGVNRCFYDGEGSQITDLAPLRGEKGGLYEGGIRVPWIARWPGQLKSGLVCDEPVISTDLLPTFVEAAAIELPAVQIVDGQSLLPLLRGQVASLDRQLFVYFPDYHHDFPALVVREGDFKLIESAEDGHLELYDLADDIGEQHNLAAAQPDKATELKQALHAWRDSLGARLATPNSQYDPQKQHLLDPDAEEVRLRYLPVPWPPER